MQLKELDHSAVLFLISVFCLILHQIIILFLLPGRNNDLHQKAGAKLRFFSVRERLIGIITLGVLPLSFLALIEYDIQNLVGFGGTFYRPGIFYIIITIFLILILAKYVSNRADPSRLPSAARYIGVSNNWLVLNTVWWGMYLFAYELLLRGFLLFSSFELFGFFYSILINCLIYSLIHIPKGRSEAFGAIPFGVILCLITLYTESIWGAYILHMTLAVSMDWMMAKKFRKYSELNI